MSAPRCSSKLELATLELECELPKDHAGPHRENCRLSWGDHPIAAAAVHSVTAEPLEGLQPEGAPPDA